MHLSQLVEDVENLIENYSMTNNWYKKYIYKRQLLWYRHVASKWRFKYIEYIIDNTLIT